MTMHEISIISLAVYLITAAFWGYNLAAALRTRQKAGQMLASARELLAEAEAISVKAKERWQ